MNAQELAAVAFLWLVVFSVGVSLSPWGDDR